MQIAPDIETARTARRSKHAGLRRYLALRVAAIVERMARHLSSSVAAQSSRQSGIRRPASNEALPIDRADGNSLAKKPRLAYVSPLPPEKSGIADYSADLLPGLARFYDIDVIIAQEDVSDPRIVSMFRLRSVEWFEAHAHDFERIVYHVGSSPCHRHMPGLLEKHPGIVVLHDFFLGDLLNELDRCNPAQHIFSRALQESHGLPAVLQERRAGRTESIRKYPCNKAVLDRATGIIVHSRYSMQLAASWYGINAEESWRHIPILKPVHEHIDREAARRHLGIAPDDFVMLSFGFLVPFKLNDRVIDAWLNSPLAADRQCHLVFVGENNVPDYAGVLREMIERGDCSRRIRITGFVDQQTYHAYLAAADGAVQLRSHSRGETSAAILDCLAYGIPTIINAHGSAAELPDHAMIKLPDIFTQTALCDAMSRLRDDAGLRKLLSECAVRHVRRHHAPENICEMYRDAIEGFVGKDSRAATHVLAESNSNASACRP